MTEMFQSPKIHYNPYYNQTIHELQHSLQYYSTEQIMRGEVHAMRDPIFNAQLAQLPKDKKQNLAIERNIASKFAFEQDCCHYCWVKKEFCYCTLLQSVQNRKQNQKMKRNINIVFLMTHKEFHRASNSAKVVLNTLEGSRFYIPGLDIHEREIEAKYFKNNNNENHKVYIMYPSDDAIPIHETDLVTHHNNNNNNKNDDIVHDSEQTDEAATEYTILVIDGTWREARRMNKTIPKHIPRIKLTPPEASNPLFDALRKQVLPGSRTSTLEAVVLALRELGLESEECDKMLNNLKIMVNKVLDMSHKPHIDFDEE